MKLIALRALWCAVCLVVELPPVSAQAPLENPGLEQISGPLGANMQQKMEEFLKEKLPPPVEASLPPPPADAKDLEGTWIADQVTLLRIDRDMYGKPLPLKPEARRILNRRLEANYVQKKPYANAAAQCRPAGQTWQLGLIYPFQIFQSKNAIVFVFSEMHTIWSVKMNGEHTSTAYMGDSVGHWDGSTLVIDTTNYKQPLWIDADGTPGSAHAHLTFRIRRINHGLPELEIQMTIDDPEMFWAPWSIVRTFAWRPDFAFFQEYDCESRVSAPDWMQEYGYQGEPSRPP